MSKIITDKCEITFAALKLVEQLYKDNEIPDYMFRNILRQYAGKEDMKHFSCCQSKTGRKVKSCTEPTE